MREGEGGSVTHRPGVGAPEADAAVAVARDEKGRATTRAEGHRLHWELVCVVAKRTQGNITYVDNVSGTIEISIMSE